jgi:tol-pal system protein YbgF
LVRQSIEARSDMFCRLTTALLLAGLSIGASGVRALAQDATDTVVRISQLEAQMRQMAGKIEELQFQNQQLREQLQRFREDAEYRFQELGAKGSGQAAAAPHPVTPAPPPRQIAMGAPAPISPAPISPAPISPAPVAPLPQGPARGDIFDPQAEPGAPGSPRPLGSPDSAAPPPVRRTNQPYSIMQDAGASPAGPGAPLEIAGAGSPQGAPPAPPRPQTSLASTGTDSARVDFDSAYAFIQQHQYEQAEMGFRSFLQSHPRSKLTADATYWLGESYLQRNRYRDAAEQFLKITTGFGGSPKGPDGMFKLGLSLRGLGASDQACATFAELARKYPAARPALLKDVQREQQRAKCPS